MAETAVDIVGVRPRGQILLSGFAGDLEFPAAAGAVLGLALPEAPATTLAAAGGLMAAWMAPRRWLVVDDRLAGETLTAIFAGLQASGRAAVSDISDGLAVIELRGPGSDALFAAVATLDIGPAALPAGAAARTVVAGVRAVVYRHGKSDVLRLHVEAAVAHYVLDWLAAAVRA